MQRVTLERRVHLHLGKGVGTDWPSHVEDQTSVLQLKQSKDKSPLERAVPHFFLALSCGPHAASALDTVVGQPQHESMHWADQMAGLPQGKNSLGFTR